MNVDLEQPSRREAAKSERRDSIVSAAAGLVREVGFDAVTMTQIAERAGVAPATLYNLFKTKRLIFQRVFDRDLEDFENRIANLKSDNGVERIFAAIEMASSLYNREPDFYRALARGGSLQVTVATSPAEPRKIFWQNMVADSVADGGLVHQTNARVLGTTLAQLMRGVFLDWVNRTITAEQLNYEASFGFALILLTHASDRSKPRLKERVEFYRSKLGQGDLGMNAVTSSNKPEDLPNRKNLRR